MRESSVVPSIRVPLAALFALALGGVLPAPAQDYPSRVRHHHRAVSGGRADRPAGARSWRRNSPRSSGRTSSSRTSAAAPPRSPPAASRARRPTGTRCCCTICRSPPTSRCIRACRSTPRRTSRRSPSSTTTRWCWSGASRSPPNTLGELIAWMKTTPAKMAHPGTGSTGHLATALFAQEAKVDGRSHSLPRRRAGAAGHRRRPRRSVLRHAAIGAAGGHGRADEGLRHHREGAGPPQFPNVASMVQELGPKLEISYWHAMLVAGRHAEADRRQAQRACCRA